MLKVMLDTNVLYSAVYYPSHAMNKLFDILYRTSAVVLCDYIINELRRTAKRKMPEEVEKVEILLKNFPYQTVETPDTLEGVPKMRDEMDTPILAAAIRAGCGILISGDKDFLSLNIDNPQIMNITDFIEKYQ